MQFKNVMPIFFSPKEARHQKDTTSNPQSLSLGLIHQGAEQPEF